MRFQCFGIGESFFTISKLFNVKMERKTTNENPLLVQLRITEELHHCVFGILNLETFSHSDMVRLPFLCSRLIRAMLGRDIQKKPFKLKVPIIDNAHFI